MTPAAGARDDARDNVRGALWMALSVLAAAAMTLAVKAAAAEMPSAAIVAARAAGGLALCLAALGVSRRLRAGLRFSTPRLHLWRGALIGVSTQLGFWTVTELPLAQATVLFFTAPVFAALLAIPAQGERIGAARAAAIGAGFLGVLIVTRPWDGPAADGLGLPALAALGSSLLFALALISGRGLATRDGAFSAYVSSAAMTLLVSLPLAGPVWAPPSSFWGMAALGIVVLASLARNIADIEAYRLAEAGLLAPLSYTRLAFIAAGAWALFDETPDAATLAGGAVIVAAALHIARRERIAAG